MKLLIHLVETFDLITMSTFDELIDSQVNELMKKIPPGLESWDEEVQEAFFKSLSYEEKLVLMKALVKASKEIGTLITDLKLMIE